MALHPEPADLVGVTTLERISAAPAFNRWMFDRLRRWVGRRVLEVGAGVGNLSQFLADRERVALSDTEAYYLARLRERFAGRANVAVVELRLPDSSGYELCEFIRASSVHRHVPVLLLSDRGSPGDRANADEVGADAFLVKPYLDDELRARVEMLLDSPRGGRARAAGES